MKKLICILMALMLVVGIFAMAQAASSSKDTGDMTDVETSTEPTTEPTVTEAPATEAPATEAPATEAPATEAPATEAPATEAPATEAPATEAPATETPATEVPTQPTATPAPTKNSSSGSDSGKSTSDGAAAGTVADDGQGEEEDTFFVEVLNDPTPEEQAAYEELLEAGEAELEKLGAAEKVEDYFGDVKAADGSTIDLREALEAAEGDTLKVSEFAPFIFGNYDTAMGDVTLTLLFPTPYAAGEKVQVLIGVADSKEGPYEWTAFDGEGVEPVEGADETEGRIKTTIPADFMESTQNKIKLMAIVSK